MKPLRVALDRPPINPPQRVSDFQPAQQGGTARFRPAVKRQTTAGGNAVERRNDR